MLDALAETFAPPAEPPTVAADDPNGFWARSASEVGVGPRLAERLLEMLPPEDVDELGTLLDLLRRTGFTKLPQGGRERVLKALSAANPDARAGINGLRGLAMQLYYGAVDASGRNPNWDQLGYPGPPAIDPAPRELKGFVLGTASGTVQLEADVVVVGSGAGGGVIAGELATRGLDVVVLEAGGHHEAADFPADEMNALSELYWRGGLNLTTDGNVAILAGATLGGGSTINWQNCVRPPDHVRETWARDHGLDGVDGAAFDDHLDAVLERISATDDCTDLNGTNQRLADAADALGWGWSKAVRNTDPASYSPETAGHVGFGDRTGSKQGTLRTYLKDAEAHGARIVTRARVTRVLRTDGRATGVEAEVTLPTGDIVALRVDAPDVVVACGALETPALLLRSGIGGPAVGQHLRLHPVPMITALYDEDLRSWWGPPQATIVTEHRGAVEGHGYLIETAHLHPSITAAAVPWRSGRDHKLIMGRFSRLGTFIAVTRDHGAGTVTLDTRGEAEVHYPLEDRIDDQVRRHAVRSLIELHAAAGASVILDTHRDLALWRKGEDLEGYIARAQDAAEGADGRVLFSAHQMGSARMGTDPMTSVASPSGELHDVAGVWIGDTSAFPTAVGSNPMLTCMALARRTAHAILANADAAKVSAAP
ncbi:MAG: GMC family oxidoreductase [Nitriliruptor sp.]|uniref:FAD-dependent oxidoreductase n=1 Tax=Nitriliruptor sp. TaxID=2448056 RepID=UPI0034A048B3